MCENTNPKPGFQSVINPGFGFGKMNGFPGTPGFPKPGFQSLVHSGRQVDRIGNKVDRIRQQSTLLPICCRFRQESTFNKVDLAEFNFVVSVYIPGFSMTGLLYAEENISICSAVLIQHRNTTNKQVNHLGV